MEPACRDEKISMARTQPTERVRIQPAASYTLARRHRWRRALKAVILLTVPLYCVGFSMLALARIEVVVQQAASSPLFVGGLVFLIFLALLEPFTGAMTTSCATGAHCAGLAMADPVSCVGFMGGCLTVVGVISGVLALVVWVF
jgi:Ca2+/H+ antiporter